MKRIRCPECGYEIEVEDKVKRKHCLYDGHIMREIGNDGEE